MKQRKMYREPAVTGRKSGLRSMIWTRRKKINIQPEQNEEKEFRRMRRGLGTSGTTLNIPTLES